MTSRASRAGRVVALVLALALGVSGCADEGSAMPRCEPDQRLAIVAQSVPGAAYLPCIRALPAGWRVTEFEVDEDGTSAGLRSDRAARPIELTFAASCERTGSTPVAPRAEGVRSYLLLETIAPRYTGRYLDVFAGGCLVSAFDLERGPHIALLDELRQAVELYPRRDLSQELRADLDVTLDP